MIFALSKKIRCTGRLIKNENPFQSFKEDPTKRKPHLTGQLLQVLQLYTLFFLSIVFYLVISDLKHAKLS